MAVSLKHAFVSPKADGTDATQVQPSNWNAEHTFVMASGYLLGRTDPGAGPVQEVGVSADFLLNSGVLGFNPSNGVAPFEKIVALAANRTLTSTTATQAFFDPANDALAVEAATSYFFEGLFHLSSMSGTSGNCAVNVLGGGTATVTSARINTLGLDNTTLTTPAALGGQSQASSVTSGTTAIVAGTGTAAFIWFNGILRINAAGTIIPSVALTTAAAAVANANSYFRIEKVGSNTFTQIGGWA